MTKINKLQDIEIYKSSLILARKVYAVTRGQKLVKDYSLIDQLRRAALSVSANIAEGYGRKTKKDFAQFLSIALGSANELSVFLEFIQLEYQIQTQELRNEYDVLAKRIYAFRKYLYSS